MKLRRITSRLRAGTIGWLLLLAFLGYNMWPQVAAAFGVASANQRAPSFQLTTLDGQAVSLESLRGQVVLVNFWATWCPPCRVEMPGFQSVYERKRAQGFTILGISLDSRSDEHVAGFLAERGITYPVAMASGQVVSDFGGVNTLPTSFLIDRDGRIRHEVRGVFASMALEQAVDRLLAEQASAVSTPGGTR